MYSSDSPEKSQKQNEKGGKLDNNNNSNKPQLFS